jgi:pimeloyl-ACP methyl ester carboxylesterase
VSILAAQNPLESRFPEKLVALPSGATVAVRIAGHQDEGPSVVLLHGISSGAASWLHTVMAVQAPLHLVAWDAPGYGQSSPLVEAAPTDADYADCLGDCLAAMGIGRCVVVGHSLGALIACAYARGRGQETLDRLVLISPAGGYGSPHKTAQREKVRAERRQALAQLGVNALAERTAPRLLTPDASADQLAWVRWNAQRLNPGGYLQAVELLCQSDLGTSKDLGLPIEVHCGDADIVTSPDACRAWAAQWSAPFHLIAAAGHASPTEQAPAVAQIITNAALAQAHHAQH